MTITTPIRLRPYRSYQAPELPWLSQIPAHWTRLPLHSLTRSKSDFGHPELPLLSVYREYGVVLRASRDGNHNPEGADLARYKAVAPGDLVLNKMKTWQGSLGVAQHGGIVSPAYYVCSVDRSIHGRYLHHLLRSHPYIGHYQRLSSGVRIGQWELGYGDIRQIPVLLPPVAEQVKIARFIDHHGQRSARLLMANRQLKSLLQEQRQALIDQELAPCPSTDGSDATEQRGERAAGWQVLPLKRCVSIKITDGPHETPPLLDSGVHFISAEAIAEGRIDLERCRGYISPELHEHFCQKLRPQRSDIFMCKSGATTGRVALVETDVPFSVWSPLALIRADPRRVHPRFLYRLLQTRYVQDQVHLASSYGTQPNLAMSAMERLLLVVPPLDEQLRLLDRLEADLSAVERAAERTAKELVLLREYLSRLITELVTGQLDLGELPELGELEMPAPDAPALLWDLEEADGEDLERAEPSPLQPD